MNVTLTVLATVSWVVFLIIYFMQVFQKISNPNPATWIIWTAVVFEHAFTWQVEGWIRWTPFVLAVGFLCLTIVAVFKKSSSRWGWTETIVTAGGLGAFVAYLVYRDVETTNVMVQAVLLVSYWPTWRMLYKEEADDYPLAWVFNIAANVLVAIAVMDQEWTHLLNPIVIGVMCNGIVLWLAIRQQQRKSLATEPR